MSCCKSVSYNILRCNIRSAFCFKLAVFNMNVIDKQLKAKFFADVNSDVHCMSENPRIWEKLDTSPSRQFQTPISFNNFSRSTN